MRPEVAQRRIQAFRERFGEAHFALAIHAAFPLALNPDLLYRLWANFQQDIYGNVLKIPWLAVADLLLSSLCDEVGHELYEMPQEVRNCLLAELKANPRFGSQRINELSDFLLTHVKQQLESHNPDLRDFAQAQRWTALAYVKPGEVAQEIASTFAKLNLEEKTEWARIASIIETFAEPLAGFEPLLHYSRGIQQFIYGKSTEATVEFNKAYGEKGQIEVAGVDLSIPTELAFSQASLDEFLIEQLELPTRIFNGLKRNQINSVADLLHYVPEDLTEIKSLGQKAMEELVRVIHKKIGITKEQWIAYSAPLKEASFEETRKKAFEIADAAIFDEKQKHLDDIERVLLSGAWERLSYEEIARESSYTLAQLKETGRHLWKALSVKLKRKVTKNDFHPDRAWWLSCCAFKL